MKPNRDHGIKTIGKWRNLSRTGGHHANIETDIAGQIRARILAFVKSE